MTTDDDTLADDDLTGRLTDLLTRSADGVDVRPDLDAVVDAPTVISLVDDARAPGAASRRDVGLHPVRRLALGAVAAAAVVALVAAVLAVRDDDPGESVASAGGSTTTSTAGDAPTGDVYPVVDAWPEGFELSGAVLQDVGMGSVPGPSAVIGTTAGDAVVGGITVQSFRGAASDLERAETTPVTVGGREGLTLQSSGHAGEALDPVLLLRDGEVLLVLSGDDPVGFVEAAPDAVTARVEDGEVHLAIGDLPAPYELLRGPTTPPDERTWPSLQAHSDVTGNPPPFVFVEVRPGDPLAAVVNAGTAQPIAIGEHEGWIAEGEGLDPDALGSTYVAWAPTDGVTVSVSGAVDRGTALAVARSVRLVDRTEWEATYADVTTDLTDDGTTTTSVDQTPTTAPVDHPLTPRFADLPDGVEVEVEGPSATAEADDRYSWALLGRVSDDGRSVRDAIELRSYQGVPSWWPIRGGEPVTVVEWEGRLFPDDGPLEWQETRSEVLVLPATESVVVIGADPLGQVTRATDLLVRSPADSGPSTIDPPWIPPGVAVIGVRHDLNDPDHAPFRYPSARFTIDGQEDRGRLTLAPQGHGDPLLAEVLTLGDAEAIDLGDGDAWLVERSADATALTWFVDGVQVMLDVALDRDTALEVAEAVRFPTAPPPTTTTTEPRSTDPYCSYPDRVTGRTTC